MQLSLRDSGAETKPIHGRFPWAARWGRQPVVRPVLPESCCVGLAFEQGLLNSAEITSGMELQNKAGHYW